MQNWNWRHIYKIPFFIFWAIFCTFGFKVWKSTNITWKLFFAKNQKGVKICRISRWIRIRCKSCWKMHHHVFPSNFFGAFFQNFFTNAKSAWNSGFFNTQIEFLKENFFFALFSTFCKLWLQMRRKRLRKTENLLLWMCLRI